MCVRRTGMVNERSSQNSKFIHESTFLPVFPDVGSTVQLCKLQGKSVNARNTTRSQNIIPTKIIEMKAYL